MRERGYIIDTFIDAQLVWAELIGSHGGGCFTIMVVIGRPHSRQMHLGIGRIVKANGYDSDTNKPHTAVRIKG